jgi:hypothetical protein
MTKEQHLEIANSIQGWMINDHLSILYDTTKNKELVVEIGCWKGRTTSVLAVAERVICIDSWIYDINFKNDIWFDVYREYSKNENILEEFKKNLSMFNNIDIIIGESHDVANQVLNNAVDLLVIDGDHSYDGIKGDLELYFPKLKNKGIIFCHDYGDTGVDRAIHEFIKQKNLNISNLNNGGVFLQNNNVDN